MRIFGRAKTKDVCRSAAKICYLVYVIRCHHINFQPNRTTLGRPTSSPPENLIKSPSSLKMVGAPPAPDGPPPKYVLHLVYVRRYHHIDFQPNRTTLGRPTSSPPKNPHLFPPLTQLFCLIKLHLKKNLAIAKELAKGEFHPSTPFDCSKVNISEDCIMYQREV